MTPRHAALQKRYRRFALYEAKGESPLYEDFTNAVSSNDAVLDFLESLPPAKQQPNLLLAAVRAVCGIASNGDEFCAMVLANADAVTEIMRTRATQTNEPARCAVLLPLLAALPQPLSLIEVGTSAGLCLYPDRYEYRYNDGALLGPDRDGPTPPRFQCSASPNTPRPSSLPNVAWRAGIDLNPLDVTNPENVRWLELLVWPEHEKRRENLRRACDVVATAPPRIIQGPLLQRLEDLAAQAPVASTLVIFHSAVLGYEADPAAREAFVSLVTRLNARWISNEHPRVFPSIAAQLTQPPPRDRFLLAKDGVPAAFTGPHGQSIDWL